MSTVRFEQRIGARKDPLQRIGAGFPIERELHALVEEHVRVARVERTSAAVFGGAVECAHELAFGRPNGNAARVVVVLGDPHAALRVESEAVRGVHVLRIVFADVRCAWLANCFHQRAGRREDFDLMRGAAVADDILACGADGDVSWVFEVLGDDRFGFGRSGRCVGEQLVAAEHQHAARGIKRYPARTIYCQAGSDGT